ncbi:hypothetical protein RN001_000659 [Aquatica leii]|uniref:Rap-GAP domain-containing protein n=1 Tax=Aquatica leii TaxID=1421715 RepID=A0AAN7QM57_9COLE|nr:hypothetical protein RN001_000659 [Aquatica leii]
MFSKKSHLDVKKSTSKIQDIKKDLTTRLKHLKIILDNVDTAEAKGIFETNFSYVYHILYECFIEAETHLRQRVHKAHKEELENVLWILEQILSLLPELLHKRWQIHSLGRILAKLLHYGNSLRLRRQAIKYFLMWYQALDENAPDYVHEMFAGLVPGFTSSNVLMQNNGSIFHDTVQFPVQPAEILPILPPSSGEKLPEQPCKLFLETVLEYMVSTVVRLEWQDRTVKYHRCFSFLLEKFKIYYLPKLCPSFCYETSLYNLNLDLPMIRKPEADNEFITCRVSLIKWVATYMQHIKKNIDLVSSTTSTQTVLPPQISSLHDEDVQSDSVHTSLEYSISLQSTKSSNDEDLAAQIAKDVLCSTRENVNFVHEIYRQAFLLNFGHAVAIRKAIAVYKDLIQSTLPELPPYILEPPDDLPRMQDDVDGHRSGRLRTDSYLGAIHRENLIVRAGLQNVLQTFMTHAANVFLLEVSAHFPTLLEEQTDVCKRVLNIYRYMVMHTRMDSNTWEQLLLVLLQITSLVLTEIPLKKKAQTLGGKLAPAIFQTLIVTWIKANLNVMISRELWDRFVNVLTSLTRWEELIKEWAKTLDTLTRVLARHVYNLDLSDLPLDRLSDQKFRRTRRSIGRPEGSTPCGTSDSGHHPVCRQDSSVPDGHILTKRYRPGLARSLSENNLFAKRKSQKQQTNFKRSQSLDNLRQGDIESVDRTRSPSPAPSSGLESTSIKDSPIQLDVLVSENNMQDVSGEHRGVVCGGTVRGWLPDVAVVLWKRMLGALGDVNQIADAKLHSQVFDYFVKLIDILIKIKNNQGVSSDNQSTPSPPELVPPLTLILPWCFEALSLPSTYESGKLSALRLLCTITLNCDSQHRTYLPHFYRALHIALCGSSKSCLSTVLRYLGPRFLSLQLPGSSLLLLDLIQASNTVLNSNDISTTSPRTEAVSILSNLLSFPDDLSQISVLQPEPNIQVMACPDIKEHVVTILLRAGRREPTGMARCISLSALGMFVYKELTNQTFHPKVSDALNVILLALKFNNKVIAQLASNILFLLCDHASIIWTQYPRLGDAVIRTLCSALFLHAPLGSIAGENDKALGTALLLCLGEWCMRLEPSRLLEVSEYVDIKENSCLLLLVFTVLYKIITGQAASENKSGLSQPSMNDDFDPNILLDNLDKHSPSSSPSKNYQCQEAIILCAKSLLNHLVTHLGHFPMAIGAPRLSSLVVEHDDVPNLVSDELSANIFTAPNIQLFVLTPNVISSLIELPALELPGGGVTAGLTTADKQVRVLLRDLSGKACWDASILYCSPDIDNGVDEETSNCESLNTNSSTSKWGPMSYIQPESLIIGNNMQPNFPQRAMRHRPPNVLPDTSNAAPDLDQLDDLLQYLGYTSPECLENFDHKLNEPSNSLISSDLEQEAIGGVISQRNLELEQSRITQFAEAMTGQPAVRPNRLNLCSKKGYEITSLQQAPAGIVEQTAFQQCRLLFSQLGLAGWERRKHLQLLSKTERLLRELRNLDTQRCRETHKVAVIYVAPGQEDKNSILSNQGGSAEYEQFLAALAWEVELEGHTGFLGGLQKQGSNGLTAPYVATSFLEAIFHVATRMPGDTAEAVLNKTRHLGNDEVHIVWSEHNREYRRDIIPTEFCDILITIYPLGNNLNRITVNCKPEVPYFGILFSEAIVESNILAGLVRAAVICASRAKRTTLPFYQQYYEERARSLETVMTKHKDSTTYEDFISRVYSPIATPSPFCNPNISVGDGSDGATSSNTSMLAAALLDSHSHSYKLGQKNDPKFRASDSTKGVWFNNADVSQNVESTSISPRPLKKLSTSLKNVPRRSLRQDTSSNSPPESPTQVIRRK